VVDVEDPFILLVHQGMVEHVFLQDMKARGVEVVRNCKFLGQATSKSTSNVGITAECMALDANRHDFFNSDYLVGCDGAHSLVRRSIAGIEMEGEPGRAAWGVLDGESNDTICSPLY
jgi:phenol 2-monooxygenase